MAIPAMLYLVSKVICPRMGNQCVIKHSLSRNISCSCAADTGQYWLAYFQAIHMMSMDLLTPVVTWILLITTGEPPDPVSVDRADIVCTVSLQG